MLCHSEGILEEAHVFYSQSLGPTVRLGDRQGIAVLLCNLAELGEAAGRTEFAVTLNLHARRLFPDLKSNLESYHRAALNRLETHVAPQTWQTWRAAAERQSWESLLPALGIEN